MNIAIIGCGLIGQKRAKTLQNASLTVCVDHLKEKAEALARQHPGCLALTNWREAIIRKDVDMVIISTLHASLAEIVLAATEAGKHILIEKPAGRRANELEPIIAAAKKNHTLI